MKDDAERLHEHICTLCGFINDVHIFGCHVVHGQKDNRKLDLLDCRKHYFHSSCILPRVWYSQVFSLLFFLVLAINGVDKLDKNTDRMFILTAEAIAKRKLICMLRKSESQKVCKLSEEKSRTDSSGSHRLSWLHNTVHLRLLKRFMVRFNCPEDQS
jgi:hypothetical protein